MKRRKNNVAHIAAIVLAIVMAVCFIALAVLFVVLPEDFNNPISNLKKKVIVQETVEEYEDTSYRGETTWDGVGDIPLEVYDYPFDKGSGFYVSNLDMSSKYPSQLSELLRRQTDVGKGFAKKAFQIGYREVQENKEEFIKDLKGFLFDKELINGYTADEFAGDLAEWIIENEYQGEIEFTTDHSLIWEELYNYMRAVVNLKVYNVKDNAVECKCLPEGFDIREEGTYIIDLKMAYDSATQKAGVADFQFIGKVE